VDKFYSTPLFCYIVGFIFPYSLTFLPFVGVVGNYSVATHVLILSSIAAYLAGLIVGALLPMKAAALEENTSSVVIMNPRSEALTHLLLKLWYVVAFLCLSFEYYEIGGVPLLMKGAEIVRFNLKVNGYTHLLAISLGLVSAMMYHFSAYVADARQARRYKILAACGFLYLLFSGGRSDAGIYIVLLFFATIFRSGIKKVHFLWGGLFLIFFVGVNMFRSAGVNPLYAYDALTSMRVQPNFFFLLVFPFYMTLTYNFTMLDKLVNIGASAISGGTYTFSAFLSLFPDTPIDYGTFKNHLLGINFYSELTSTYLSNFYLDFGLVGAVVGSFLMAVAIQYVYRKAKQERKYVFLYAIMFTHYVILFYVFIYIYFASILSVALCYFFCRNSLTAAPPKASSVSQ
jgi:oligosaccharide repeat unit polymerase